MPRPWLFPRARPGDRSNRRVETHGDKCMAHRSVDRSSRMTSPLEYASKQVGPIRNVSPCVRFRIDGEPSDNKRGLMQADDTTTKSHPAPSVQTEKRLARTCFKTCMIRTRAGCAKLDVEDPSKGFGRGFLGHANAKEEAASHGKSLDHCSVLRTLT
ncbi:hypothetical protein BDY21DRAFT_16587 [Lineolata rhizophorae]|uniref:Uncharacterized protein n=1 Tax=Lineolata rhizophorae TaxID=578093 RepID=A0A6A6P1F3_9PEZI|nr:hypothetical protein BDY21DRAFT_16587 [Lineolata rhizophorae]